MSCCFSDQTSRVVRDRIKAGRPFWVHLWFSFLIMAGALHAADPATMVENSLGMKLVLIPAGTFNMGSPFEAAGRQDDESPHKVTISVPFYLGATEVTQAQWLALMGSDKSFFKGAQWPMEKVSWQDANLFCQKLSEKETRPYRLPTEAEWEYACRGAGPSATSMEIPLAEIAWYSDNAEETTRPVGMKKPNGWGLYDMLGNVAEWVADFYESQYPNGDITDPKGPEKATYRVMRGGSWSAFPMACRCAARSDAPGAYQLKQTGFRVLLEVESR
jgi:formylglycine-generating enzyme required for sulfatase activity